MNDKSTSKGPDILKLDQFWPYQVTVLADRIARRTSTIVKQYGLNLSQWRVLAAIAEQPGRTAVEVVTMTPMDKGIVSRATRSMLEKGLVERVASQSDGRVSHLHLTLDGDRLYQVLFPQIKAVLQMGNDVLSRERLTQLNHDLSELMEALPDLR
ncbi:MAG: MarR family transcriptional regulator [Myxococcales bacterium]|nr:MarR family transcriptional regulator [Myxococcales bacterium]|tara:strand:+ start:876 stop:1340 length:465 start_codon:yes stop_codon:yes gene_type:complete